MKIVEQFYLLKLDEGQAQLLKALCQNPLPDESEEVEELREFIFHSLKVDLDDTLTRET